MLNLLNIWVKWLKLIGFFLNTYKTLGSLTLFPLIGLGLLIQPQASLANEQTSSSRLNKNALKAGIANILDLNIDFTSDNLYISRIPDGLVIENETDGLYILTTQNGSVLYNKEGDKLSLGLEAVVIKDLIINAIFLNSHIEQNELGSDNHPDPCPECHPCPAGMDCTPPEEPPEEEECDPDTAPDGCECPQEFLGIDCNEDIDDILDHYQ